MLLGEMLARTARQRPDAKAVLFRDQTMTYAELEAGVRRLAAGLAAAGIGAGDHIALLLPNCPQFVLGYYAAGLIGAVTVPVNPLLKPAELEYIWRDADVRLVITVGALLPCVQAGRATLPALRHVVSITPPEGLQDPSLAEKIEGFITFQALMARGAQSQDAPGIAAAISDTDCAVVIYTSGTTGHPKGAMLSHRNLTRNVEQVRGALNILPQDSLLTVLPLFHAFAGTVCMNLPIAVGAATVLLENFVPSRTLETLERHRVTLFPAVPAIFGALLAHVPDRDHDLSSLRLLISGGAPLPAANLSALEAHFGIPVLEGDGPTECSPVTSVNREEGPRKVSSVGPPLPGVEIAIFDDDDRPMPTGEVGEIVVRGDNVMLSYLNQPEATQEAMRNGWYHTGDLGRLDDDGFVYIVDRKKDMIITAGLNVYPREVEEVLLAHPAVADVAVIGMPDALRGEEVAAVVVLHAGAEAGARDLIGWSRERLANYKAPRQILFRDALPRGGTGKVVKRLLKKELELEAPEQA